MLGNALADIVNRETLRLYGKGERFVPVDNLADAMEYAQALRVKAEAVADAVATLEAVTNSLYREMVSVALTNYHSVALDAMALAVGQAIALKDPTRFDGRYSEPAQKLADTFR